MASTVHQIAGRPLLGVSAAWALQVVFAMEKGTKSAAGIGEAICGKANELKASMLLIASHGR